MRKSVDYSLWTVFRAPVLIGAVSAFGLVAALLTDGPWDAVWALGVGVPLVVVAVKFGSAQ